MGAASLRVDSGVKRIEVNDNGDYIAVSNVLAEETATIDIKSGYLYVIRSRD